MTLRIMRPDDYDGALSLWSRTEGMGMNDYDDSREAIGRFLSRNPGTCFVAEEEGALAGVLLCGHDGRRGYLYHMAVDGRYRRRGIGKALLDRAMEALWEEGIRKAALVVFRENQSGNRFWESEGFSSRDDLHYRSRLIRDGE